MEIKVEKKKRRSKSTRFLAKLRGKTKIFLFVAVVLVSCTIIYTLINKTDNYKVVHSMMILGNYFMEESQNKQENLSEVSERIRTLAENIRTPPNEESKLLYNTVRVLCWVLTMPSNHVTRARHVKATWGRRCNKLIFMSSTTDTSLGAVNINVSEGRQHLWEKTRNAFEYVYENNIDDADWFLKADDDTYVIVENLRHFLRNHSSVEPVYFGYQFGGGFLSGGAGYVLSRRSVQLFVERGLRSGACPNISEAEDVQIDACLKVVGAKVGDSRDSQGRDRFFPFTPLESVFDHDYYDNEDEFNITSEMHCSHTAITFHYVSIQLMYLMEYSIYHLKILGGAYPEEPAIAYQLGMNSQNK